MLARWNTGLSPFRETMLPSLVIFVCAASLTHWGASLSAGEDLPAAPVSYPDPVVEVVPAETTQRVASPEAAAKTERSSSEAAPKSEEKNTQPVHGAKLAVGDQSTVITVGADSTKLGEEASALENPAAPVEVVSKSADGNVQQVGHEEDGQEPEVELVRERFSNGNVKVEREVALDDDQNYINHGSWSSWSLEGAMTARGQFRFGKPHGDWVRWYEGVSGKLFEDPLYQGFEPPFRGEISLRNGQLHGSWSIYDARDRLASSWEFAHNVREGQSVWRHPNGQIAREVEFHGGQLDGDLIDRDENGAVTHKTSFVNGRELVRDMLTRADGSKIHEGWILKAHTIHNPRYDWWNANVTAQAAAESESLRHGKWIFWRANGERRVAGQYDLGKKSGEWMWWYESGQRQTRGSFKNDVQEGEWVWWHPNGHRRTVGLFENGEAAGAWSSWDTQGKLQSVANYSAPEVDEAPQTQALVEVAPAKPLEEVPAPDLQALRESLQAEETLRR